MEKFLEVVRDDTPFFNGGLVKPAQHRLAPIVILRAVIDSKREKQRGRR